MGGDVSVYEGGDAVDIADVGVEGTIAFDDAVEVSEFVEDGGEEVIFTVCGTVGGGFVRGVC